MEKCMFCDKKFKTIRDVMIHCARTRGGHPNCKQYKFLYMINKENVIKCELCDSFFNSIQGLILHVSKTEKISKEVYFKKFPNAEILYKKHIKNKIIENIVIDETTGCWNWLKTKPDKDGYRYINGIAAHRLSYEIFKEKIPPGMMICHNCDNPSCINPDHLYCGTSQTNMDDMKKRGRSLTGDKNPSKRIEVREKISKNNAMNKIENKIKISTSTKGISRPRHNYILYNVNGESFNTNNLYEFCKERNLDYRQLLELSQEKRKYISGWNCVRLS
jgi:hypothetical protein